MTGLFSPFLPFPISFCPNLKLTYPSLRCIQVIAGVLGRAGESGQAKRLLAAKTGEITWLPPPGLGKPFDEEAEKRKVEAAAKKRKEEEEKKALAATDDPEYGNPEKFEGSMAEFKDAMAAGREGLDMDGAAGMELSEADKAILEKVKQSRDERGLKDDDPLSEEDMEILRTIGGGEGDSEAFEKAKVEFKKELEEMQERFNEDLRRLEEKMK